MKKILVIAAHPDDEVLGCGGTIAKYVDQGDEVHIIFTADGVSSRGNNNSHEDRCDMARSAAKLLGAQEPIFLPFPDNMLDSIPLLNIVQAMEPIIAEIKPEIIYTHHEGDLNVDHSLTSKAVITACRPLPGSTVKSIYGFEVLSSTEWSAPRGSSAFIANFFVDIKESFERKIAALNIYDVEMRDFPHARSYECVEAQAVLRGGQNGLIKAEAFSVIREIW